MLANSCALKWYEAGRPKSICSTSVKKAVPPKNGVNTTWKIAGKYFKQHFSNIFYYTNLVH